MVHLTFLSHFVFCLAAAAAAALAAQVGVFHTIWDNDLSMMTSVIGALLVGTAAYLGRQAWMVGSKCGGPTPHGDISLSGFVSWRASLEQRSAFRSRRNRLLRARPAFPRLQPRFLQLPAAALPRRSSQS